MTLSNSHHITDELLSAYIDGEVTEQERTLVETALAQDEQIAWRLDSMRQTVTMLRELPEIVMPRSFTLTLDQLDAPQTSESALESSIEPAIAAPIPTPTKTAVGGQRSARSHSTPPAADSFWEQLAAAWRGFWQGGNPILRNAAAVSFALMLLVTSGGQILSRALTQPVGMMATSSESAAESAAPASAAPAAEMVALAPTATESEPTTEDAADSPADDAVASKAPDPSARVMQAPEATSSEDGAAAANAADSSVAANAADAPVVESASAAVAEAAPAEDSSAEDGNVTEQEAAEEAIEEETVVEEPEAEPAIAAAMVAPSEATASDSAESGSAASSTQNVEPPLVAAQPPIPGSPQARGGGGGGIGSGGGSDDGIPPNAGGGASGSLVPEEAYGFDVDPLGEPTAVPAEEAANMEAAPASVASATTDDSDAAEEIEEATADEAATEAEAEVEEEVAIEQDEALAEELPADTAATSAESSAEATNTPAAVALVAPEPITSSEVVENVPTEGEAIVTSRSADLAIVQIAQGSALLLTIVLSSLWWRSRSPRRPNQ